MLCLDLDVMERNARRMADQIQAAGKDWRPHVKSHCLPQIASTLLKLGAVGVTTASVAEATVMADAGVPAVLIAHLVANPEVLQHLPALSAKTRLLLTIDHYVHAELLSQLSARCGHSFAVLVDVDIGMGRTGIRPGYDATELAVAAARLPGIDVVGLMGYEGHLLQIADVADKRRQIFESMNVLQHTQDRIRDSGVACPTISAGGSGSFQVTAEHPGVTELQAGGGIFGDPFYTQNCGTTDLDPALWLVADVVSRPSLTQAVLNCGRKLLNPDICPPQILEPPGATIRHLSAEHTVVEVSGPARDLRIGDQVRVVVGYSDLTLLLHRQLHVFRGETFTDIWSLPQLLRQPVSESPVG